jgi:hypothetical protein
VCPCKRTLTVSSSQAWPLIRVSAIPGCLPSSTSAPVHTGRILLPGLPTRTLLSSSNASHHICGGPRTPTPPLRHPCATPTPPLRHPCATPAPPL